MCIGQTFVFKMSSLIKTDELDRLADITRASLSRIRFPWQILLLTARIFDQGKMPTNIDPNSEDWMDDTLGDPSTQQPEPEESDQADEAQDTDERFHLATLLANENLTSMEKCVALQSHLTCHRSALEAISAAAEEFQAYSNKLVEAVKEVADGVIEAVRCRKKTNSWSFRSRRSTWLK